MHYSFLADALVILHLAFVAFVVLGQLAILVGIIFKKSWARSFVFRTIHLICIGVVATEGMLDVECPLTVWERNLRTEAGQDVSEAPFIPQLANRILFYPDIPHVYFERMHIAFGCMVLLTFLIWPPMLQKKPQESLN